MRANRVLVFVIIVGSILGGVYLYYSSNKDTLPSFINTDVSTYNNHKKYIIKKAGQIIDEADTFEEAKEKALGIKRSIVINTYNSEWVYCDLQPYLIITDVAIHDFETFGQAYQYAQANSYGMIYYKNNKDVIWKYKEVLEDTLLDIPLIPQLPELPRGCEVTSLAMLLQYRGVNTNKLTLAKQVKKDLTPYYKDENDRIHYGNPYDGFVGDMYNTYNNGYGVYHGPIVELASLYCGNKAVDITDINFNDILYFIEKKNPVWVVVNSTYAPLSEEEFEIWHTPTGIVKVTKKLHAVVITGFNKDVIYINDPLDNKKNKSVNREAFKQAWEQMGNQAMIIMK